jgi:hypothetical protein
MSVSERKRDIDFGHSFALDRQKIVMLAFLRV